MRKIAVFTGTRAEYGLLRPVLMHLQDAECSLQLIVSGTHLSPAHGYTLREITQDGFTPSACIPLDFASDTPAHLAASLGQCIAGLGEELAALQPEVLVLLGDRYECLAAASAATMLGIPVAHIHGGEITQGAMDDVFRHAITKMSHMHFASCEAYRQRIIQLGEEPGRVWNVGALGVENALTCQFVPEQVLREDLKLAQGMPYFLCTFHPVTLEAGEEARQLQELLSALETFPRHGIIFTGANADPGGNVINRMLHAYAELHPQRVRVYASLGVRRYLSAASYAACVAGNSSSGILEIPSLGTPVVDIGNRQKGRIRAESVLHCSCQRDAITAALSKALTAEQRTFSCACPNPYQGQRTSFCIAEKLLIFPLKGILQKVFFDLQDKT